MDLRRMKQSVNCPCLRDGSPLTDDPVCPSYPCGGGGSRTTSMTTDERGASTDSPVCNKVARSPERRLSICKPLRRSWKEQERQPANQLDVEEVVGRHP